jgi:hypothetical protein
MSGFSEITLEETGNLTRLNQTHMDLLNIKDSFAFMNERRLIRFEKFRF